MEADCSALLNDSWFEDVLYTAEGSYPSVGTEKVQKWVGVAEKQADAISYLIFTADTDCVISRSAIHSATTTKNPDLRAHHISAGAELYEKPKHILQSTEDLLYIDPSQLKLPKL
jgi:hypothetical protein